MKSCQYCRLSITVVTDRAQEMKGSKSGDHRMEPAPHRMVGQRQKVDHRWRALKKQTIEADEVSERIIVLKIKESDLFSDNIRKHRVTMNTNLSGSNRLKQLLFERYKGFADKRIKDLTKSNIFIIDELGSSDFSRNGDLLGGRCRIFCKVLTNENVQIILSGSVPLNPEVESLIKLAEGDINKHSFQDRVTLEVNITKTDNLKKIGIAIGRITKTPYEESWFKYACPKTSSAILRFCDFAKQFTVI